MRHFRSVTFRRIRWAAHHCFGSLSLGLLIGLSACKTTPPAPLPVFQPAKLLEMDAAINQTIAEKSIPGGALWLERNGHAYHKAYGHRSLVPAEEPMTEDTIFDAASLTKVIACTPAVMLLVERGQVKLDAPVHSYIPEFAGDGKEAVTIRQLLTHTSGLRPDIETKTKWHGQETAIQMACREKLQSSPGTTFRYSDINFFLLGEVVQRVTSRKLEEFVTHEIYQPLKMMDTGYVPPASKRARIAPTEMTDGEMLRGTVHDPTARLMGGVAGHAGLFTTATDLARYARMMLNEGTLEGVRIFKPETVRLMTSVQSPPAVSARRGLGWDIDSGYSRPRGKIFPLGSYGHTGFTGGCLWIDPFSKTFWIFLSNRVHPDGKGSVATLQATLANLAAEAVVGFNFAYVPGSLSPRTEAETNVAARVVNPPTTAQLKSLNGIDVFKREHFARLKGLRIGLITNHTGTDRERNSTIDLLKNAPDVTLKLLFSPEHGIRGALDEKVGDSMDEQTGLPIYSLYGVTRKPKPDQLKDLDALVFDIQDVGCRFYTYISTMGGALEAAAEAGIKMFVLDRVNPINGATIDGPVLTSDTSYTAFHPVPVRYGMTIGELARMLNDERQFKADLTVIPVENWSRDLWFDQTGLPWINPSPNMRGLTAATLYPGVGLLETTAVSVGRGTDTPFEVVGAPYIDDVQLAEELNRAGLAGVRFVPVRFTPTASVFKDKSCGGVNMLLTERERCNVVDIGLTIAQTLHRLYPANFDMEKFNRLLGHSATIDALKSGKTLADVKRMWVTDLEDFQKRRAKYLLY
ncbi:MAG: DUF1343 domain-containing protein [Verrucomicrobia bacterium]|nr:DUF1343 domain-containing protein [Verrucomicrobiota bacterium]